MRRMAVSKHAGQVCYRSGGDGSFGSQHSAASYSSDSVTAKSKNGLYEGSSILARKEWVWHGVKGISDLHCDEMYTGVPYCAKRLCGTTGRHGHGWPGKREDRIHDGPVAFLPVNGALFFT